MAVSKCTSIYSTIGLKQFHSFSQRPQYSSSIHYSYLTLIRVIKCTRVICCWQEPQKHSLPRAITAWKSIVKKNTISSCSSSEKVLILNFKTIQFCCLSREVLQSSPPLCEETSEFKPWVKCNFEKDFGCSSNQGSL